MSDQLSKGSRWRLDNYLLLNQEVVEYIQKEIVLFIALNGETENKALLWDTFKEYIRGVFVNLKVHLLRKKWILSEELLQNITSVETLHKATRCKETKQELDALVSKSKLLGVTMAARKVMFAKQQFFEFRDKPNKHLAQILAESREVRSRGHYDLL